MFSSLTLIIVLIVGLCVFDLFLDVYNSIKFGNVKSAFIIVGLVIIKSLVCTISVYSRTLNIFKYFWQTTD